MLLHLCICDHKYLDSRDEKAEFFLKEKFLKIVKKKLFGYYIEEKLP